jgi:3-oxosteroid 1-dehydrogenase
MRWDGEYDVVVVGSGVAGLSAALVAHEAGLRTVVVEKADRLGGSTTYSYGLIWIPRNHLEVEAGYSDSLDDVLQYMQFLGGGQHSEERVRTFAERCPEAIAFFAKRCGIRFRIVKGIKDFYHGRAPGTRPEGRTIEHDLVSGSELGEWRKLLLLPDATPYAVTAEEMIAWGGIHNFANWEPALMEDRGRNDILGLGVGLAAGFIKALAKRQVPMWVSSAGEKLVVDSGRVIGIELVDGKRLRARKGVMLSAGGYESNAELTEFYEGLPECQSKYIDTLTGDAMIMASEQGAAVRKIHNSFRVHLGFRIPRAGRNGGPAFRSASIIELCSPHTLVINRSGQRFANEAYFQSMAPKLREFDAQKRSYVNLPCFLIFDQQYVNRFSFAGFPPGNAIPDWVERADTIEALSANLGVDKDGLNRTIARFNGFAACGVDEDFGRGNELWKLAEDTSAGKNPRLGAISMKPFYGIELHPSPAGSAGLDTNTKGQVMHLRRFPIPGLYSSGNSTVHTETGLGYQPGMTIAAALTFSYLAVRDMAENNN